MTWTDAFRVALNQHWPKKAPRHVGDLRHVLDSLPFAAPEIQHFHARRAWDVYLAEGDTEIGRAAVALAYAIQADRDNAKGRAQ